MKKLFVLMALVCVVVVTPALADCYGYHHDQGVSVSFGGHGVSVNFGTGYPVSRPVCYAPIPVAVPAYSVPVVVQPSYGCGNDCERRRVMQAQADAQRRALQAQADAQRRAYQAQADAQRRAYLAQADAQRRAYLAQVDAQRRVSGVSHHHHR